VLRAFRTPNDRADFLYDETLFLLSQSSTPSGTTINHAIALIERAKAELKTCSPATVRRHAAQLAYLWGEKYENEQTLDNLNGCYKALKWNLEVDDENLQVHAKFGFSLYYKSQIYSEDCMNAALAIFSRLAAKADQRLSSLLEAMNRKVSPAASNVVSQENNTRRTKAPTSIEVARLDPINNPLFDSPKTARLVCAARSCLVFSLEDQYLESREYRNSALDDLIAHAEPAVAFLSACEQLGLLGETEQKIDNLSIVESALSRALMARLFRYSSRASVPALVTSSAAGQLPLLRTSLSTTEMTTRLTNLALHPVSKENIYKKSRLTLGRKHIRLLDLHPGAPDEAVLCTLRIVDLEARPEYEVSRLIQRFSAPFHRLTLSRPYLMFGGTPKL
jgi:hypothetical protein